MVVELDRKNIRNASWWTRRTNCERRLCLSTLMLSFTTVALITTLTIILTRRSNLRKLTIKNQPLQQELNAICLSPVCNRTASSLQENMNHSASPCEDFFQFTCGGLFKKKLVVTDEEENPLETPEEQIEEQIRAILEERPWSQEPKAFAMARRVYKTCMNENLIEKQGLKEIRAILRELGGWPVLEGEKWDGSRFDWRKTIYRLRKIGYDTNFLFDLSVTVDPSNETRQIIWLNNPSLAIPEKDFYSKTDEAYYDYAVEVATIFGADRNSAVRELKESVEFEGNLAEVVSQNDDGYYSNPIAAWQIQFPILSPLEYIREVTQNFRIESTQIVRITNKLYVKYLASVLGATPKRVLANYLLWRVVESSVPYLTQQLKHERFLVQKAIDGDRRVQPRWKDCIEDIFPKLDFAITALYVRRHPQTQAIKSASKLLDHVQQAFRERLKRNQWMDDESRRNGIAKLDGMKKRVGYPKELLDNFKLNAYYEKLELNSQDYLRTILNVSRFQKESHLEQVWRINENSDWFKHLLATESKVYYSNKDNSMNIPSGILQRPFFETDKLSYVNYGILGYMVAHQLLHGFDYSGQTYGVNGTRTIWTTNATKLKYQDMLGCNGNFVPLKVVVPILYFNVREEEKVVDVEGLRLAYWAYRTFSQENCPEPQITGFDYNSRQMFWISAASLWCRKTGNPGKSWGDEHLVDPFAELGAFKNSEEFAEDFECPLGSAMNPEKKCLIW